MRPRIPFDASMLDRVADFDCGTKPYQTEVSDWIKASVDAEDSALRRIKDGSTDVWLYESNDGDLVGFASLGLWSWNIFDQTKNKKQKTAIQIIPNFAVKSAFKRKPEPPEDRYAVQILDDVLQVADSRMRTSAAPSLVGLLVYAENKNAIKLYEDFGFVEIERTAKDYIRMFVSLAE